MGKERAEKGKGFSGIPQKGTGYEQPQNCCSLSRLANTSIKPKWQQVVFKRLVWASVAWQSFSHVINLYLFKVLLILQRRDAKVCIRHCKTQGSPPVLLTGRPEKVGQVCLFSVSRPRLRLPWHMCKCLEYFRVLPQVEWRCGRRGLQKRKWPFFQCSPWFRSVLAAQSARN